MEPKKLIFILDTHNCCFKDINPTQPAQLCQPKMNCQKKCTPSCSEGQFCVSGTITECGVCPPTHCIQREQFVVATNVQDNTTTTTKKTAFIAGLTSGLVVLALVVVTIAGFIFYRRRRRIHRLQNQSIKEYDFAPPMVSIPETVHVPESIKPTTHHWNNQVHFYL